MYKTKNIGQKATCTTFQSALSIKSMCLLQRLLRMQEESIM